MSGFDATEAAAPSAAEYDATMLLGIALVVPFVVDWSAPRMVEMAHPPRLAQGKVRETFSPPFSARACELGPRSAANIVIFSSTKMRL